MPYKKNNPGCPCCDQFCVNPCANCLNNKEPDNMLVEFAGMANGSCSGCTGINVSFLCPYSRDSFGLPLGCSWTAPSGSGISLPVCTSCHASGSPQINVQTGFSAGTYKLSVRLILVASGTWSETIDFLKDYGATPPDCCNLIDENIPLTSHVLSAGTGCTCCGCDSSGLTCTVTAA